MAFFLSLVVSWSNPRLREKRLFSTFLRPWEFTQKILHYRDVVGDITHSAEFFIKFPALHGSVFLPACNE